MMMKFRYKNLGQGILRPVIPIEIKFNDKSIGYEVLADSGADFCIFDAQIGELLGIDIQKGEKREVSGITGTKENYYVHKVIIGVGGWPYEMEVGFLPNMARLAYGVVGQIGFFDKFIIKFDYKKEEIEIKERDLKSIKL